MLHDLITDEPPYVLDPAGAAALGRRRRARHLALAGAGTAAAVAGSLVLMTSGGTPAPTSTLLQPGASPSRTVVPEDRWLPIVRKFTPAEWTVDVRDSSDDVLVADVDDGQGPSRLWVSLSPHPGSLQQHPCSDSEFVRGGKCEEKDLGDGRTLVTRELAEEDGFRSVTVIVVHRDGGGVDVSSHNATWPVLPAGTVFTSSDEKVEATRGTVTRAMPLYDAQVLVELAKAVDARAAAR